MAVSIYLIASVIYVGILFIIVYATEKQSECGKSLVSNPSVLNKIRYFITVLDLYCVDIGIWEYQKAVV